MQKYGVITHTDMDGIGSAALYIYLQGEKPVEIIFSEPYNLDKGLSRINPSKVEKIALMDLGMNPRIMDKIFRYIKYFREKGLEIEWYDHHVWDKSWINKLEELGVKLYIDRTTCATGVIAKYAPRRRNSIDRDFIKELVDGVCAGDLWRFDHWRGPWYLRLVRRRDSTKWRLHVIDVISQGVLWSNEFTDVIIERVENELREYSRLGENYLVREYMGVVIAVAPSSKTVDNSFSAAYVMGRTQADIVAIVSNDGKISFRSRTVNVREIATRLGGGGHPRAAGAKIKVPLIVRLKTLFNGEAVLRYVLERIIDVLNELGKDNILLKK